MHTSIKAKQPDLTALLRVAASHAIECALDDSTEPHIILDIAKHQFGKMFNGNENWPERGILN